MSLCGLLPFRWFECEKWKLSDKVKKHKHPVLCSGQVICQFFSDKTNNLPGAAVRTGALHEDWSWQPGLTLVNESWNPDHYQIVSQHM